MNPRDREHRFRRLKEMGCIACLLDRLKDVHPEIHHLNGGGHAGQKRRGDEFTIPLCQWHHQGKPMPGTPVDGPTLKYHSRAFRQRYGTDDALLSRVNSIIAAMDAVATVHLRTEAERTL